MTQSNATIQKRKMISAEVASEKDFVGCDEGEIRELEISFCVTLPSAFKDFLAVMGKSQGDFAQGYDCIYPCHDYREIGHDIFAEYELTMPD